MLIRFSFKNFKSFKNENCLDMEATSLKEHEYNVAKIDNGEYLKVSAIYGANASGKTNVLQAFDYMKKRILVSDDSKKNSPIDEENVYSFMINNDPIALEVEILAKNNKIYKYGFEVLNDKIISEWLFEKRVNKFYSIFETYNIFSVFYFIHVERVVDVERQVGEERDSTAHAGAHIIFLVAVHICRFSLGDGVAERRALVCTVWHDGRPAIEVIERIVAH